MIMKKLKYIGILLLVFISFSCEKNEIEYDTTPSGEMAEFQLHYMVPVTATSANNITKVEINNKLVANIKAPLSTYNAIPNGSVGRFYTVEPGLVNIKLYQGSTGETLVYDQNVTLLKGKQNIFVHDFTKPPVLFDNGYPYSKNTTMNTDSTCYVKFYHFLYETAGVTCPLKLQYQYINPVTSELVNIGQPILFGETTGWQKIKIKKEIFNSSGSARVDYRIKVIDTNGTVIGDLSIRNSSGVYVNYADFWTGFIGRRYHHVISGMRAAAPASAVRQFTAL